MKLFPVAERFPDISSVDNLPSRGDSSRGVHTDKCGLHGDFYRSSVLCNNPTTASELKGMTCGHSCKLNA